MKDHLLIRADASAQVGIGHIMRCLALAQAWQGQGGSATFLGFCARPLRKRIQDQGFGLVSIEAPTGSSAEDLDQTLGQLAALRSRQASARWVVLDGYHFGYEYQKGIQEAGYRLLVIDDYNHQARYSADILLNQNINAEHLPYACNGGAALLLGTRYILLRSQFLKVKDTQTIHPATARKVLVTLGGADAENATLKVVQALKQVKISGLEAKIVLGAANPNITSIREEINDKGGAVEKSGTHSIELLRDAEMPGLMTWADIAVSAGGSTCWELLYMGVPTIILTVADNQEGIARGLKEHGAAENPGWVDALGSGEIAALLERVIIDKKSRRQMSVNGRGLVDGRGAERVVQAIVERADA